MATQPLRFTTLDKATLKADLIAYLQGTSEFQNFNFNASGISSLLDLLTYNTYYQALMANFQFNETFLDTASKRQNAVSRANELGYTPKSKKSSKATLSVTVTNVPGNPSTLVIPAGAIFATSVNNIAFNFTTLVPYSANLAYDALNQPYYLFTVDVYEGILTQNSFVMSTDPSVDIPNMDIDTDTLRIYVTLDTTVYEFYKPTNFLTVTPTNKVYFLVEGFSAYKLFFGDDTFGYRPPIGSPITASYVVTSGSLANGASVFSMSSSIPGATSANVAVTTTTASAGGADMETLNSIKLNASNFYATQDRAVISDDYRSIIKAASSNVKDVLVWGGEQNNPPMFGKVVACVIPSYGDSLSIYDQNNIRQIVSSKAILNNSIVFTTPVFVNMVVHTTVRYDSKLITLSTYDLQTTVQSRISDFVSNNLTKFNGSLRISQLWGTIDRSDSSIVSNITKIQLKYKYTPKLYQNVAVSFSYNNKLDNNNKSYVMKSSLFYVTGQSSGVWLEDDTNGNIHLFYSKNGIKTYASYNIGTIKYETGDVLVSGLNIVAIDGQTIDFIATPADEDLNSSKTTIIQIDSADVVVDTVTS